MHIKRTVCITMYVCVCVWEREGGERIKILRYRVKRGKKFRIKKIQLDNIPFVVWLSVSQNEQFLTEKSFCIKTQQNQNQLLILRQFFSKARIVLERNRVAKMNKLRNSSGFCNLHWMHCFWRWSLFISEVPKFVY